MRDARGRRQVSLSGLLFWSAGAWGGVAVARALGVPAIVLLLLLVVLLDVASLVWGHDSRDGRDWPRRL
jgi:hypothetical protein